MRDITVNIEGLKERKSAALEERKKKDDERVAEAPPSEDEFDDFGESAPFAENLDPYHALSSFLSEELRSKIPQGILKTAAFLGFENSCGEIIKNVLDADADHVMVTISESKSGTMTVTVKDNGKGFPDSMLPAAVATKSYGDVIAGKAKHKSEKDRSQGALGGCGQGLAQVYHALKFFNGDLEISRSESGGAVITFSSPNMEQPQFKKAFTSIQKFFSSADDASGPTPEGLEACLSKLSKAFNLQAGSDMPVDILSDSEHKHSPASSVQSRSSNHPGLSLSIPEPSRSPEPITPTSAEVSSPSSAASTPARSSLPKLGLFIAAPSKLRVPITPTISVEPSPASAVSATRRSILPKLELSIAAPDGSTPVILMAPMDGRPAPEQGTPGSSPKTMAFPFWRKQLMVEQNQIQDPTPPVQQPQLSPGLGGSWE